jgi:hypothetical protein
MKHVVTVEVDTSGGPKTVSFEVEALTLDVNQLLKKQDVILDALDAHFHAAADDDDGFYYEVGSIKVISVKAKKGKKRS